MNFRAGFARAIYLPIACLATAASAEVVDYTLTIDETRVAPTGADVRALTINGTIPGPVLRFREGDTARITVRNALRREDTSIHWHGVLVPNAMDGVPYLTTPPIPPGGELPYEFPIRQSGTYWYHSHTGLQEQIGVYGAIVIEPRDGEPVAADRDYVVVLSDWTNEDPDEVMRTLMRGSEWYAIRKGNAQSLLGAARAGALGAWFARERSRMAPMDVSDVAYDAFLANGRRQIRLDARPGDRVRLRVINAAASTYFYLHSATGPLTIVAADGPAVEPVAIDRLLVGMAETYDVIVTIPDDGIWEFRATAQDNSGHASVMLGPENGPVHAAADLPPAKLYRMDHMMEAALVDDETPLAELRALPRPGAPYAFLRSSTPTTVGGDSTREITLRLTGDMRRYIWSFNGETLSEHSTIPVSHGEVLRIHFINDTMMHHPLHLHGHFFRVLNRYGAHAPLKHTVDVPPMGSRTIEFLANEYGDWFFHCHLLYHMDAGMSRVFSYRAAEDPSYEPTLDPAMAGKIWFMTDGMVLHNMSMGMATLMRGRDNLSVMWDYGYEREHRENELDFFWSHYFDANLSSHLGYRLTDDPHAEDRFFGGVTYRLPYMIDADVTVDSEGDIRFGLTRELQLTPRLSVFGSAEYDTHSLWEFTAGAEYVLTKRLSLASAWNSDHGVGVGVAFHF